MTSWSVPARAREPRWISELRDGETLIARVGRWERLLVAEFPSSGTLWATRDGLESEFLKCPGAEQAAVQKIKDSVVEGLLRHLRGQWTLHGSAVAWHGRAIGFLGDAGAGKSTLGAALCATANCELIADDTLHLDMGSGTSVAIGLTPSQKVTWLRSDACAWVGAVAGAADKSAVAPLAARKDGAALCALVVLKFHEGGSTQVRRLHGAEAFSALARSFIRFVVDEPNLQLREFDVIVRLQRSCAIVELARPRHLGKVADALPVIEGLLHTPVMNA